jgi:signal peptidase I
VTESEDTAKVAEVSENGSAAGERPRRPAIAEWAITVVLLLFATTLLIQSYVIPTVSMEDTLLRGDHLLVDKLSYAPDGALSRYLLPYRDVERGDIIVFRWPIDLRQNYVKRVVGVPGDRLRIVNKQVYLNGLPMQEHYAVHKTPYFDSYRDNFPGEPNVRLEEPGLEMLEQNVSNGEVVVPPDHYFVMGDNRDNSLDSRYWGFVPKANIIGKPLIIFWSYDAPTERLADPNIINPDHIADLARNFFSKTRWNRTFRIVRARPAK